MSERGSFNTTLIWDDGGDEVEADVRVLYSFVPGYPATQEEPGVDCEVEIISITPKDPAIGVPEYFDTDEDLLNQCVSDYLDEQEYAAEWRAQCRRDDLLAQNREQAR
jgi:hypothetical protein